MDPYKDLRQILHKVERPARYTGGEWGMAVKEGKNLLQVALSYPDLYEIGMSNFSVRLLYRLLNSQDGVYCQRVFAPGLDFEAELRARRLPLYALESGRTLRDFDLLGFSVGYELTLTNLLNILQLGGLSLFCAERGAGEPIVIAGGPAVTNPLPLGPFVDAVFIGEAEARIGSLFSRLAVLKQRGASRQDLLECLLAEPSVWSASKGGTVVRGWWNGFGARDVGVAGPGRRPGLLAPVPNLAPVQDHGVVEIMRGCPHGCRFCQAGIFYRPFRLKEPAAILTEVEDLVFGCGYREITLSSLSSGDYPGITDLVRKLNRRFAPFRASFALPSLRINSLTLSLLSELAEVRKSGLTFAVETPLQDWQRGINKLAPLERTVELLKEARRRGWRNAKFYFMVGLPVAGGADESGPIVEFLRQVRAESRVSLNINVACFIPKPHTPFQWAAQLSEQAALDRIMAIKRNLDGKGFKVRYHSPFLSLLEGLISRGEERAGMLAYRAFKAGARLDAWEEHIRWDVWRKILEEAPWEVEEEICRERDIAEVLPWAAIDLGVSPEYLKREYGRAKQGELTDSCRTGCSHHCGVCRAGRSVKDRISPLPRQVREGGEALPTGTPLREVREAASRSNGKPLPTGTPLRVLFSFIKEGKAIFLGHLDIMRIFQRALLRAGYLAQFSQGFNPQPKLEFAQPLSLGIASRQEMAAVLLLNYDSPEALCRRMNQALPQGLRLTATKALKPLPAGQKKRSLMACYWGSDYLIQAPAGDGFGAGGESGAEGGVESGPQKGHLPQLEEALGRALSSPPGPETGPSLVGTVLAITPGPEGLTIRHGRSEKGGGSLLRLLSRLGVEDPLRKGLVITRLAQWADNGHGEPVSYFEALP